jgi:phage/plasmid-like protein (TIGR03299 family)
MSHNLNINNGVASMMYFGEAPWHKLGTKLDKPATASEAIETAGLGFEVVKFPLKTVNENLSVPNHFATVRKDTMEVLGVVGSRYEPIQNKDAFTVFDALVGEGQAIYHTAGVLGKGERIWILAKLPDYIRINGNDIVDKFLLLTNTHDGSTTVSIKLTPVRVVCENTLSFALSGSEQQVQIRHTLQAEIKLKQAHEILGLSNRLFEVLSQYYQGMSMKQINSVLLNQYVKKVFPPSLFSKHVSIQNKIGEKVLELFETGTGSDIAGSTVWGAYNAVTEYVDHYRLTTKSDSARLKTIWFGSGDLIKKKAFTFAVEMLN